PRLLVRQRALRRSGISPRRGRGVLHRSGVLHGRPSGVPRGLPRRAGRRRDPRRHPTRGRRAGRLRGRLPRRVRTVSPLPLLLLFFLITPRGPPASPLAPGGPLPPPPPADLSTRAAFVRLISGGSDWDAAAVSLAREHARWADGIRSGRPGAVPGVDVLRVR